MVGRKLPLVAYLFDEETGAYLNATVEAIADPTERGKFTIPVNATLEPPPSVPDPRRQVAVYRNDEWHVERKGSSPDAGTPEATATKVVTGPVEEEPAP